MSEVSDEPSRTRGERGAGLVPRVPGQVPVTRASTGTVTAVIVVVAVFLYLVRPILAPFVFSGIAAYICMPLVERLAARAKLPRWLAATMVALAVLALLGGIGALVVPLLVGEIVDAVGHLRQTIERVAHWWLGGGRVIFLGQETSAPDIAQRAVAGLRDTFGQTALIASLASSAVTDVVMGIMTIVLLFYFMIGGPAIAKSLFWLAPPRQRPFVHAVWAQLDPVLSRYFIGIAVVVVYATAVAYVGLGLILHLRNAAVLAVATGLLETVPVAGPIASAVLGGLAALQGADGVGRIAAYAVYALVLRFSVDQVVSPLVLGRAGRVHPVLIIFSFLAGGLLFNIVGIVLAIPVALTIKVVLATLYEEPLDDAHPETSKAID